MQIMNPKERVLTAMLGKSTDRVSVYPAVDICYASKLQGINIGLAFCKPEIHAKVLEGVFVTVRESGFYP